MPTKLVAGSVGGTHQLHELAVNMLLPTTSCQQACFPYSLLIVLTPGSLEH
jgi:hypothetical protein